MRAAGLLRASPCPFAAAKVSNTWLFRKTAPQAHHQRGERRREGAEQRPYGEHHDAADVDALVAPQLAQRGEGQQEHHHGQLEGVDYPYRVFGRHTELRRHAWQRDVAYRAVEHREEEAAERGRHGVVDARAVQPVPGEVAHEPWLGGICGLHGFLFLG